MRSQKYVKSDQLKKSTGEENVVTKGGGGGGGGQGERVEKR